MVVAQQALQMMSPALRCQKLKACRICLTLTFSHTVRHVFVTHPKHRLRNVFSGCKNDEALNLVKRSTINPSSQQMGLCSLALTWLAQEQVCC